MLNLQNNSSYENLHILKQYLKNISPNEIFEFQISDPNYKDLVDIAQIYYCKMLTPKIIDNNTVIIRFQKLNTNNSFHIDKDDEEKYGINSNFATIDKNSYISFLYYYTQALNIAKSNIRETILNLGVNSGDEFQVFKQHSKNFTNQKLLGIDYCPSAIKKAKDDFQDKNIEFLQADIKNLDNLNIGKFDLVITIGTLQSSNLNFNLIFQDIVQKYLNKQCAIIIGFPNCRWIDSQMIYGAKIKNYNFPESSLLFKDVIFCKKYLQQKKFKVTITGKDYIFLTATRT